MAKGVEGAEGAEGLEFFQGAFRQEGLDGLLLDFDDFAFADVHADGAFADGGDFSEESAGGDDFVADGESGEHFAVLLGAFLLRANEQEVKHHDDENQREEVGDERPAGLLLRGGLREGDVWGKHGRDEVEGGLGVGGLGFEIVNG